MTIKCGICGKQRDPILLGAFKDIFYCADDPKCVANAKTLREVAVRLGKPDPLAHLKVLTHGHEKKHQPRIFPSKLF